jgi:hypothetical protein
MKYSSRMFVNNLTPCCFFYEVGLIAASLLLGKNL